MPITPIGMIPGMDRVSEANPAAAVAAARAIQAFKKKEKPVPKPKQNEQAQDQSNGKKFDGWA